MNKLVKLAVIAVALTAVFSYSVDMRYGIRTGYFITSMDGDFPKNPGESIDNGYGFSVGLISRLGENFTPEMNVSYSKIWVPGPELSESKQQYELAINAIAALRIMPLGKEIPFYLFLGPQFDIPIHTMNTLNEVKDSSESEEKSKAYNNFSTLSLASGLGIIIADKIGIDARCVIGFSLGVREKGTSFNQYGAGISYLFGSGLNSGKPSESRKQRLFREVQNEELTDPRDGKIYETVTIGSQTWMAENLNYDAKSSKCYDNEPENCEKYGRLYNWETAMKVCPSGWHLPSNDDWNVLMTSVGGSGGTKLKATSGWNSNGNGTDEFGFSALPGGDGGSDGSSAYVGKLGYWWSATEGDSSSAYSRDMGYGSSNVYRNYNYKSYLFSVRCVKD